MIALTAILVVALVFTLALAAMQSGEERRTRATSAIDAVHVPTHRAPPPEGGRPIEGGAEQIGGGNLRMPPADRGDMRKDLRDVHPHQLRHGRRPLANDMPWVGGCHRPGRTSGPVTNLALQHAPSRRR